MELIPEAKLITEFNSGTQPFVHNYLSLSLGLLIVLIASLIFYAYDIEKSRRVYNILKGASILLFLGASMAFFILREENTHLDHSGWEDIPSMNWAFGYVFGIYGFSFTQPVQVP